jgi:hypothetical protein
MSKIDANGNESDVIAEFQIEYRVAVPAENNAQGGALPFRLLSVESAFEISIEAALLDADNPGTLGQRFITRSALRLPVGWECIEIYPTGDTRSWRKDIAAAWAERDILASVLAKQLREKQLRSLDPNVDARRECATLIDAYKQLLDSNPPEETLQQFIRANPILLSPTQTRVWPKVVLGSRVTDFIFREADGDYTLVELEAPSRRLFIKNGDTSSQLTHARDQITDWRRYLEDNLATVQRELGLDGISPNAKGLIVIGRSDSLLPRDRRKLTTWQGEAPRNKILTYDDVLENAKAAMESIVGPLWAATAAAEVYMLPTHRQPQQGATPLS